MTTIEKIKAEIERRITDNTFGAKLELIDILAWLDTLESEKPMNLEEEINRYLREECSSDDELGIHEISEHFAEWGYLRAAEKYNEIEYNRQRAEESVPNDLEEAANRFAIFYDQGTCDGIAQDCFIAGAEWQEEQDTREMIMSDGSYFQKCYELGKKDIKEQMMKEAVEGEVCGRVYDHINVRFADGVCKFLEPKNISHIPADVSKYKVCDKVRIIIVKE